MSNRRIENKLDSLSVAARTVRDMQRAWRSAKKGRVLTAIQHSTSAVKGHKRLYDYHTNREES